MEEEDDVLSSTFEGVARVATRLPPMAISSNATPATASWSRSCSLKSTRACVLVKGSGCSPPCVTRWSGGAVVHDRGALLRRGLRRRTTTHHVVELGSQHYRGQFNVVPGTVFFGRWLSLLHALAVRRAATCCRRARRASFFWWWWWCSCCQRGDGSVMVFTAARLGGSGAARRLAASALVQHCCHGRSGSFQRCYGCYDSSASAEALRLVAPCACLLTCLAWQLPTFCMLVSNTASSAFCVGLSFVSSYLFPEGITTI